MIILEKPYVSNFLIDYLEKTQTVVLCNSVSEEIAKRKNINLADSQKMRLTYDEQGKLYTSSESALQWVYENLGSNDLIHKINKMKNKTEFRRLLKHIYPNFFFQEVHVDRLHLVDIHLIKKPFILKPAVGFFSVGVYKIMGDDDWNRALEDIKNNLTAWKSAYKETVVDNSFFILEEYIEGEEFAVDAYYDQSGEAVILNILKHEFSSDTDVSDRLYYTGKEIITQYNEPLTKLLNDMNRLFEVKNFPLHVEVRIDKEVIIPIEFNPLRFAGWCTTDIAYYAYGMNNYDYFLNNQKPDFDKLLKDKDDMLYSIIVLDKPKGIKDGALFNYERFAEDFRHVMHIRKVDARQYPIFGFAFTKTHRSQKAELDRILKSDFKEYIV